MTEQEALLLFKSKWWVEMTDEQRAVFQLHEPRLCMPFDVFHKAVEVVLGRPVWTHEFAAPRALIEEMEGQRPRASLADVLAKLPAHVKAIIIAP